MKRLGDIVVMFIIVILLNIFIYASFQLINGIVEIYQSQIERII
jgi:uncharacterized membrane protein YqiK